MIAKFLTLAALLIVWFGVVVIAWSTLFPLDWVVSIDNYLVAHGIHVYGEQEFGNERVYDFMADLTIACSAMISFILTSITYRFIKKRFL